MTINNIDTSPLGFGSAGLSILNNNAKAIRILETAYASGITHFDTARLYGYGQTESIVGSFAKNKRDKITIATKFGLNPPTVPSGIAPLIGLAKKALKYLPAVRQRLNKQSSKLVKTNAFSVEECRKSLETSLRELKTDYIDIYLLHECTPLEAANHELFDFLTLQKQKGIIRTFGVGTNNKNIEPIIQDKYGYEICQFENGILNSHLNKFRACKSKKFITHSSLRDIEKVKELISSNKEKFIDFKNKWEVDVQDSEMLAVLILAYCYNSNKDGITLFSSAKHERIRKNSTCINPKIYPSEMVNEFSARLNESKR